MELTIDNIDPDRGDLHDQVPIVVDLLREIPGEDRPDYWLASPRKPIKWLKDNHDHVVSHLVIAARWQGTRIEPGVTHLPVGIAFVTDQSLLDDEKLDLKKCSYVAIGIANDTSRGAVAPLKNIMSGNIARSFGTGVSVVASDNSLHRAMQRMRSILKRVFAPWRQRT